jgi:hypothetical protein
MGKESQMMSRIHKLESRQNTNDSINAEYIKKVLIKFLEYSATGEYKEAKTLEKVLFTVLEVGSDDQKTLEKLRNQSLISYYLGHENEKKT